MKMDRQVKKKTSAEIEKKYWKKDNEGDGKDMLGTNSKFVIPVNDERRVLLVT